MAELNPIWGFFGGSAEFRPAGEMEVDDEQTGQKKHITWDNHILVTVGRRQAKLRKGHIVGLAALMKENKEFREYVDRCP